MSSIFVEIMARSFTSYFRPTTGELVFVPNSYRIGSMGGPVEASITAYGTRESLFDLIETLRCPIRIFDWYAQDLFWGFISQVQVRAGALEISVTLDGMANKVAVEFSSITPGEAVVGEQQLTDWAQDAVSIDTYGTKELIAVLADVPASLADVKRNLLLDQKKYPVSSWYMSGEQGSLSATILCKGWWNTLDWKYFQNNSGYEAYTAAGEGVHPIGNDTAHMYCAQSFQLGVATGWYASRILVKVRKQGTPTDNMRVSLYSNSAGSPGSELAYAIADGATLPTDYNWVLLDLSTRVWCSPGTIYWVVITRSGGANASDYYMTDVNEELQYTRGVFRYGDGASWNTRSPDADMNFEVEGVIETTDQLKTMVESAGQFITGVKLEVASGVYSCPYRPGTTTALEEALVLLQSGTTNIRRMLAEVMPSRVLRIYEEPARPINPTLLMSSSGRVRDRTGALWPAFWSPAGRWVGMNDVIPSTLDTTRITNPYMVFIDEYSYSFEQHVGTLYPRTEPSPWDVGVVPEQDKP
jgi:hypothetical protein